MAEIPVERKSSVSWWLWLLLAILAISLLVWLFTGREEPIETAAVPPAPIATPAVDPLAPPPATVPAPADLTATGPITELATITGVADPTALIGRQVTLTAVPVPTVPGDRTFWVGEGENRLFVLLPELRPGRPTEDSINVNPGQSITVSGTLRRAQEMMAGAPIEGLPAETQVILVADRAEIIAR